MTQIISVTQHGNFTSGIKEENFHSTRATSRATPTFKVGFERQTFSVLDKCRSKFIPQSETRKDSIRVKLLL